MSTDFGPYDLNPAGVAKAAEIEERFQAFFNDLAGICSQGREMSLVFTKLQEACFFAKRALSQYPINNKNWEQQ